MTKYSRIGAIFLIAMALCVVSAVHAQGELTLEKTLLTEEPVYAGDRVDWEVQLANSDGGTTAMDIEVAEILGDFLTLINAVPDPGTNFQALTWSIPELDAGESVTLTLETRVADDAEKGDVVENCVTFTPIADDVVSTELVCDSTTIAGPSTTATITIKPETLNLKSRGVFTVFIKMDDDYPLSAIDGWEEALKCGGATLNRLQVTQKDGGTLMAKFRRQDLDKDMVKAGEEVEITCEGIISSGGETVKVRGTDTIRVIGEKKKGMDAFFAGILDTIFPIEDDGEEATGDQTATTTETTPTPALNRGQLKKAERNGEADCTENCDSADSQTGRGNGKKSGTDSGNTVTGSGDKGNQGKGNGDTADTGNGNGKGNSNKPDNEKGNDKNKK